jgi:DNA-directed RNA polymerase subunit H (RpoH/RPB5)
MPRKEKEVVMVKIKRVDGNKVTKHSFLSEEELNKLLNYEIIEIPSEIVSKFRGIKVIEEGE